MVGVTTSKSPVMVNGTSEVGSSPSPPVLSGAIGTLIFITLGFLPFFLGIGRVTAMAEPLILSRILERVILPDLEIPSPSDSPSPLSSPSAAPSPSPSSSPLPPSSPPFFPFFFFPFFLSLPFFLPFPFLPLPFFFFFLSSRISSSLFSSSSSPPPVIFFFPVPFSWALILPVPPVEHSIELLR